MNRATAVDVYDSQTSRYHQAFQVFLNHTDQKDTARLWLNGHVGRLPQRRVLIDAGAGTGKVTAWFIDMFQQTIAIEPNSSLCEELKRTCPTAVVLPTTILQAQQPTTGDLVLCSHVFYYLEQTTWMQHLQRLVSWVSPGGSLVVVLQNPGTDCMRMLEHFFGERFNLSARATTFEVTRGKDYEVTVDTIPAHVETTDFTVAYTVAEFMLNLLPMSQPPSRVAVQQYIRQHFSVAGGRFRFSCDQDFLQIRPRLSTGKEL